MVRQGHGLLSNGQAGTTCSSDDDAGFHSKPPLNFVRPAFEVVAALSLVMFAGGGIVLLNRFILVDLGFAYPIAVAAVGQSATALFALLAFRSEHTISWRFYWTNIAFIGFASAASLALGQAAYLYLTGKQPIQWSMRASCTISYRLRWLRVPLSPAFVRIALARMRAGHQGRGFELTTGKCTWVTPCLTICAQLPLYKS